MKWHLQGNHPELVQKGKAFFLRKCELAKFARLDRPGGPILNLKGQMEASLETSFVVAYRIAKAKKTSYHRRESHPALCSGHCAIGVRNRSYAKNPRCTSFKQYCTKTNS